MAKLSYNQKRILYIYSRSHRKEGGKKKGGRKEGEKKRALHKKKEGAFKRKKNEGELGRVQKHAKNSLKTGF